MSLVFRSCFAPGIREFRGMTGGAVQGQGDDDPRVSDRHTLGPTIARPRLTTNGAEKAGHGAPWHAGITDAWGVEPKAGPAGRIGDSRCMKERKIDAGEPGGSEPPRRLSGRRCGAGGSEPPRRLSGRRCGAHCAEAVTGRGDGGLRRSAPDRHEAAIAKRARGCCVSGAGCPPEFQLDAGSKFQGRSSRMRDCGWPAAIFSSVFVSQA